MNWLKLVEQIAPLVLAATPLAPIAPFVAIGIHAAEQIPGASGATKLAVAQQITHIAIQAVNTQAGHEEVNPALADGILADGISAVVGAVNLKHAAQVEDAAEVVVPAPVVPPVVQ